MMNVPSAKNWKTVLAEFFTPIGAEHAKIQRLVRASRLRLFVVFPLFLVTYFSMRISLAHARMPSVSETLLAVWLGLFVVYGIINLVTGWLPDRGKRLALYLSIFIELGTNHIVLYGSGTLLSNSVLNVIIVIAVYRVFFDYYSSIFAAIIGGGLFLVTALCELGGLIPVAPGLPHELMHAFYANPDVGITVVEGVVLEIIIVFLVINFGMNQSLKLHRYITYSVLRRYLPMDLVKKAEHGELSLDAPPERMIVTVMFTDIVGFTPLSERMGAQAVGELLNRILSSCSRIAEQYNATIDKYIGDGMMLFFGAPLPMTEAEQAKRCVDLGLRLVKEVPAIEPGMGLNLRVGINTGEVVVGNFGSDVRSDYTIIGPAVNIASRLEALSRPGNVLVSKSTARLLKSDFSLEPAGQLKLKGVSEPVEGFFVTTRPESGGVVFS